MKPNAILCLCAAILAAACSGEGRMTPLLPPDAAHAPSTRRHQGIPSVAVSKVNARLWCTYYADPLGGENHLNYCVLSTSDDGGATWQEVLIADPDGAGLKRAFDPEVWIAPDGKLRWTWTERTLDPAKTDLANNWNGYSNVASDTLFIAELDAENVPKPPYASARPVLKGVMMCKPTVVKSGDWVFPLCEWNGEPSSKFYATRDGRTFRYLGGVTLPKEWRQFDEEQMVELSDGRWWALIRTATGLCESFSSDGGRTWSKPVVSKLGHPNARLSVSKLSSGRLLLVKHGRIGEEPPGGTRKVRRDLRAFLSADDGRTWRGGILLDGRTDVSYPDVDVAANNEVFIVYDHARMSEKAVLLSRLDEDRIWNSTPADRAGAPRHVDPRPDVSQGPHVFSMSCKVNSLNGAFATPEGRAKAIRYFRKNHITKLWLESYRHAECVSAERLKEVRDAFRAEGFETCGMITPTQLNTNRQMVCCWTDPVARRRLREEVEKAASVFDCVIMDDFLFTDCTCERCTSAMAASGAKGWGRFRRGLLFDVCEHEIVRAARAVNPKARFIIKYPCWHDHYGWNGYDPAWETELFGECWIGTETRDANPNPLQACWIVGWMDWQTNGRCGGGWYDPLDSTPEKYVEQARYTILGGARESLRHCYDYLAADDPGITPFGEKMDGGRACAVAYEREATGLLRLAALLQGAGRGAFTMRPDGVSRHVFAKNGLTFVAWQNTSDKPVALSCAGKPVLTLPDGAVWKDGSLAPHGFVLFAERGEFQKRTSP